MTSTTVKGYCDHCKQNVNLIRQEIDACLIVILLLFTAGIGVLIYLLIYYRRPKNRCEICGLKVSPQLEQKTLAPKQIPYQQRTEKEVISVEFIEGEEDIFCPLCGAKLDEKSQTICPNCGSEI